MLNQYQILDKTVDTGLHPPHQRVLSWSINAVKVSVENGHFLAIHFCMGIDMHASMQNRAFHSHRQSKPLP